MMVVTWSLHCVRSASQLGSTHSLHDKQYKYMLHGSIMPYRRLQNTSCKPLSYDPPKHFDAAAHPSCLQIGALASLHCTGCFLPACLKAHHFAQDARDVSVILLSALQIKQQDCSGVAAAAQNTNDNKSWHL